MSTLLLSHFLSPESPAFGGRVGFNAKSVKCIGNGDSSNSQEWTFSNHLGTHVDCPLHFFKNGKSVDQIPVENWIFSNVFLFVRPASADELIGPENLEAIPKNTDLILLKTSFEDHRGRPEYWRNNPGLTPGFGFWLRKNRPSVRMIGFDFISLTSFQNRQLGREAHCAFLEGTKPILILEDMKLKTLSQSPRRVMVMPLFVEGADGAPATVVAEL